MDVYYEVIKEIQINLDTVNSTIKTISEKKTQHYNEIQQKNIQENKSLYTIDSFSFTITKWSIFQLSLLNQLIILSLKLKRFVKL